MGFMWVRAESFIPSVASPFRSFVTIACSQGASGKGQSPKPADQGATGKGRKREGMAAMAPRNLRCLRASAVCVHPQPTPQPGEKCRHPSGFACRRVCRQMPGRSEQRPTPS